MSKRIHQDIIIGAVLILISFLLYLRTYDFLGEAAMFPRGILFIMVFFSIFIIINGIKNTKKIRAGEEDVYEGEEDRLTFEFLKSPFATLLIVVMYISLLSLIGFFPATALFMIGFLWYKGVKGWQSYVYTIAGVNLFIYLVFVLQLNVRLPLGIFFE